jgi:hemerythrin
MEYDHAVCGVVMSPIATAPRRIGAMSGPGRHP